MTDRTERGALERLVEDLEACTEPTEELGARVIAAIVGGTYARSRFNGKWCIYLGEDRKGEPQLWDPRDERGLELHRHYANERLPTNSVDAALLTVPEGWVAGVSTEGDAWIINNEDESDTILVSAPAPALALVTASMLALAAKDDTP